jgi:hypothetical protein
MCRKNYQRQFSDCFHNYEEEESVHNYGEGLVTVHNYHNYEEGSVTVHYYGER